MGLTVWLLDEEKRPRAAIRSGISELVHAEAAGTLTAEIPAVHAPVTGECIGLRCVDGIDRLFEIIAVDEIESEGIARIEAKDAARAELGHTIVVSAELGNKESTEALQALLAGTDWSIGTVEATGHVGNIQAAAFETIADALVRIADTANIRLVPHYELTAGAVTGRKIDVLSAEPVWRGRIISARTAREIVLTDENPPMGRVYALGGWTGTGKERKRVTISSVEWSKAAGDPADKPAGEDWIDEPEYKGAYRRAYIFVDQNETDPNALAQKSWEDLQKRKERRLIGTADAGNVVFLDGWSHADVRENDLAGVRSRSGRAVQARIAEILRDYVFEERTQLQFGEKQSRSWIQTQVAETAEQGRRLGGSVSATAAVVEDNGVELYRAIEQLVELETGTATEFNQVWIDLDATATEVRTKASRDVVDGLTEEVQSLSTEFVVAYDGIRLAIQQGDETVTALKATIDGLEHWVTDAEGNVAELANTVRGLTSTVEAADGRISTLTNTADGLTNLVGDQNTAFALLQTRIDEVSAQVQGANGNYAELIVQVDSVSQTVHGADGRVSELLVDADQLLYAIGIQGEDMAMIRARVDEVLIAVRDTSGALAQLSVQSDRINATINNATDTMASRLTMIAGVIELETLADGSTVSLRLDAINDTLTAQAKKIELKANQASLTLAEDRITANAKAIALKADQASLTLAEDKIAANAKAINLKADQASLTLAEDKIAANAKAIALKADKASLTLAEDKIAANAKAIALKANQASLTLAEDKIAANAKAIELKADLASLTLAEGRIEANAEALLVKADLVELDAYVKATTLEANYVKTSKFNALSASVSNLTSGLTTAQVLRALTIAATQTNTTYLAVDSITFSGELVSKRQITMGDVKSAGKALSAGGALDLQHSHKVTVAEDGTVTLGEVATEGGNFRIADTKIYKDAVSAAEVVGWNACREACTRLTDAYKISQTAPSGGLYTLVNGHYTSVGTDWVKVSAHTSAYRRPEEKELIA